jgi:cell division protein FtsB
MRNKARRLAIALIVALSVLCGMPLLTGGAFAADVAVVQDDWKTEFEDICSKTQDSMAFTTDELKSLVDRCDALKPRIEKLDETQKKVYLKRLQMCRDLLVFVMQSRPEK